MMISLPWVAPNTDQRDRVEACSASFKVDANLRSVCIE
jgi:hypothetical protein